MLKQLKRKFIITAMLAMAVGIAGFIVLINLLSFRGIDDQIDRRLDILEECKGTLNPIPPSILDDEHYFEVSVETRYFTVVLDGDEVVDFKVLRISDITRSEALDLVSKAKNIESNNYIDDYKFRRITLDNSNTMYIFINCDQAFDAFSIFTVSSIIIGGVGFALAFVLALFFSNIALRPIKESYEKQRSFVTDASHELKTPIAIIQANTDIIEMENGQSEWTYGIKNQTERLKKLTERLVYLSKMQEGSSMLKKEEFCLSDAVLEVVEQFFAMAMSKGYKIDIDVTEDVYINGDKEALKQLVSLFLDNAMKYCNKGGKIFIGVAIEAKHVRLVVSNTLESIAPGKHDRLFDRFYRADDSRNSKTGGSGIGLAVAKEIAQAHGGSITALSKDGKSIDFEVLLPH